MATTTPATVTYRIPPIDRLTVTSLGRHECRSTLVAAHEEQRLVMGGPADRPRSSYRYRYTRAVADETYSRHLIRIARRKAGLSQTELASRAGTSQAAVSAYESGKRSPSVDTLCRLLAAAGCDVRMRLASPDTHEPTRRAAEALLPAEQVAAHDDRERRRVARRLANA